MVDRFYCPRQESVTFSFDTCIGCKYFNLTKGAKLTVKCRKNKDRRTSSAFEVAFLRDRLGMEYHVEIIKDESGRKGVI